MRKIILFPIIIILVILAIGFFLFTRHQQKVGFKNFYKLTQEDPLFYSPFFDSKGWEKSIKALRNSEDEFKKVSVENYPKAFSSASQTEKDDYISALEENSLFPYQFLQNLILINQKTNDFLKDPSSKLGKELLCLYDNAADSYVRDAQSKITALEKIDKKKKIMNTYIVFLDSISSYEIVKNDFLTIKENGDELKEEVKKRKKCFSGKGICAASPQNNKKIDAFIDSFNAKFDLKGEKIDFIKNNNIDDINNRSAETSGPYKIKSSCWQNPNYEQWLYSNYYLKENDKTIIMAKLATQNYYQKTPKVTRSTIAKTLFKEGFDFQYNPEAATYQCLDSAYYPKLLTLDFIKKQVNYGKITQNTLTKDRSYRFLIESQFGLMAPITNQAAEATNSLKLRVLVDKNLPPEEYLLAVRSVYSIFSFPFAKSIWRIDKQLQYVIPREKWPIIDPPVYFTFDDLKKLGYSDGEIKKFDLGLKNEFPFLKSLLNNQNNGH